MRVKIYFNEGIHIWVDDLHILCDPSFTSNADIKYDDYVAMRKKAPPNEDYETVDLILISHAHSDHTDRLDAFKEGRDRVPIVCHPMTEELRRSSIGALNKKILLREDESVEFQGIKINAMSAGHCGGSLMFLLETSEGKILFTGDILTTPSISIDQALPIDCDILIIEGTFGKEEYTFPTRFESYGKIRRYVMQKFAEGHPSIFMFGQGLGKNQDIAKLMNGYGEVDAIKSGKVVKKEIKIIMGTYTMMQTAIFNKYYSGIKNCYNENDILNISPPTVILETMQKCKEEHIDALISKYGLWHPKSNYEPPIAILTGWDDLYVKQIKERYTDVETFQISSHAGYSELLNFVDQCNPKKVFTFHGYASNLAKILREKGYDAYSTHDEIYDE